MVIALQIKENSQQTPNRLPADSQRTLIGSQQTQPGLNLRPHLEILLGEFMWRAHLESSFGETILFSRNKKSPYTITGIS